MMGIGQDAALRQAEGRPVDARRLIPRTPGELLGSRGNEMASFCLWLWGIIMVLGVLFWRRYPPGHEFRRVSLVLMVVATCILPIFAIADLEDTERLAAVKQLEALQRAWRENHPQPH
jgi:hypothetical protein